MRKFGAERDSAIGGTLFIEYGENGLPIEGFLIPDIQFEEILSRMIEHNYIEHIRKCINLKNKVTGIDENSN